MKKYMKVLRLLTMFGQLGFTLITPPVVMALLGWWLQRRFDLGTWIMLVALLIGLLTSANSAYRFYLRVMGSEKKKAEAEKTDHPVVYYTHE